MHGISVYYWQMCSKAVTTFSTAKLGDVADIYSGFPVRSRIAHVKDGAVAILQMKDIDDDGTLHFDRAARQDLPAARAHHLLRPGDLVFRSRGQNNLAALVTGDPGASVLASPLLLIRPRAVLPGYLHWHLNLPSTQAALAALSAGTSVQMISKAVLDNVELPVPDRSRQQLIVNIAALAALEQKLALQIATARKQLIDYALTRRASAA